MRHLSLLLTVALVAAVRADAQQTTPQYLNECRRPRPRTLWVSGSRSNSARSSAPLPGLTSPERGMRCRAGLLDIVSIDLAEANSSGTGKPKGVSSALSIAISVQPGSIER